MTDAEPYPNLAPAQSWEEFADLAGRLPDTERRRHLTTLLLTGNPVVTTARNRDYRLPRYRPQHELVRGVAAGLLREPVSPAEHVIALVSLRSGLRDGASADESVANNEAAERSARSIGDPLLTAWALTTSARLLLQLHRPDAAEVRAREALELVVGAPPSFGPFGATITAWRDTREPDTAKLILELFVRRQHTKALGALGRYDDWVAALGDWEVAARKVLSFRPRMYGSVLAAMATHEQLVYGQADLSRFHDLVPTDDVVPSRRGLRAVYQMELAANAVHRGDLRGAIDLHRQRIRFWAGGHDLDRDLGPVEMAAAIRQLPEGKRRALNDIGNPAHEIGRRLLETGDASDEHQRLHEAAAYFELAEAVWADWGANGVVAIRFRRECMKPQHDQSAVRTMQTVMDDGGRPGLRTAAALEAAVRANASTARPLASGLDRLLSEAWSDRDRARLLVARGWLGRPGGSLPASTAVDDAAAALALLPDYPRGALDLVGRAARVQVLAAREAGDPAAETAATRIAVTAVARLYSSATTRDYRARIADVWAQTLRDALALAEATNDFELADLTAEVVRRDGAAVLLRDVEGDETAPAEFQAGARDVITVNSADPAALTPEQAGADGGDSDAAEEQADEPPDDSRGERMRARSRQVSDEARQIELGRADRLFGALAAEFDAATLASARPERLIGASRRATFVLQLLPSTHRAVQGADEPRLYRRLTWTDAEGVHDLVDAVPLPASLLRPPGRNELDFDREPPVFPGPLLDALRSATQQEPIRLHIVPTDLFHLYWDALEFGAGVPLAVAAIVSVHTSLTAALRIRDSETGADRVGSAAVIDTESLANTWRERQALDRYFPDLDEPGGKAELEQATKQPISLLALALHGVDDVEGWAQAKRLPSAPGEPETWMTAAEALRLRSPEICVLASCESTVRRSGTDMAGFPTALFARGARTIIGSVNVIPDESTSRILAGFYARLHATANPVEALRDARLDYIERFDPDYAYPERWGRLVIYGGAEH